ALVEGRASRLDLLHRADRRVPDVPGRLPPDRRGRRGQREVPPIRQLDGAGRAGRAPARVCRRALGRGAQADRLPRAGPPCRGPVAPLLLLPVVLRDAGAARAPPPPPPRERLALL